MKSYLPLIFIPFIFLSCAESVKEKEQPKPVVIQNISTSLTGCYEMIIANDTAFMKIDQNKDVLKGILNYKRKDKDSNKGNVALTFIGERAEGFYTFQSEGKTSVRQIIFKINGNSFAEAYGDIEMKNDTAVYKYPHALNYEEKHAFNKVNCK